MSLEIRDATTDELDFVAHATKTSQRNSAEWRDKPTAVAFAHLNPLVNDQINRSAVLVAAQGRSILGFITFDVDGDDLVIHFVYVKAAHRRQGIARELLLAAVDAARGTTRAVYTTPSKRFAEVAERYRLEFLP